MTFTYSRVYILICLALSLVVNSSSLHTVHRNHKNWKMKLLIGFAILAISQARHLDPSCDDVLVHNIYHEKEILVNNKDKPYQLAIDYDTNTLFFSYSTPTTDDSFTSAYINLKTDEFNTIPGITGGFANTVDNKKNLVYLGGNNGLYRFDYDTKTATHIEGTHRNVWQMFFKNDVYYSTFPSENVYVFKNGKVDIVPELANTKAMLVALNNDLDFYYSNSSGLFKLTKSNGETLFLGNYNANSMTADINGNLYFSTPDGIYFINEKDKINTIVTIPNIYGVAIESDGNIIYASENEVVRLKPTKTPCYVIEKKDNEGNNLVR